MSSSPRNIAVLRNGAIGDFVVTLPAISGLGAAYPDAALRLIGRPSIASLSHCPTILDINNATFASLYSPGDLPELTRRIFADLDIILAYAVDDEGQLEGRLQEIVPGTVLVHDPRPPLSVHIVDHLLDPLIQLGIPVTHPEPRIQLQADDEVYAAEIWRDRHLKHPLVLIHIGSGGIGKCWSISKFHSLAERLTQEGIGTLILQGPVELERSESDTTEETCLLVPPSLLDLAGLLASADLFIGNDSGPGHIAAAVGIPTLTLFGPTDSHRWKPRSDLARCITAPHSDLCRLPVDNVYESAVEILHTHVASHGKSPS
jgi:heptosyltransferase-3